MENKYAFCVEELSNMGIGFETDEEMKRFSETVRNSLELRVGVAFDNILNSQEFNSLETVIDNSESEDKAYETSEWLINNFFEHDKIYQNVVKDIREELLKYKNEIPGLYQDRIVAWNGKELQCFEDLRVGEYTKLLDAKIETYGELYALDKEELRVILDIPKKSEGRVDEIIKMLEDDKAKHLSR